MYTEYGIIIVVSGILRVRHRGRNSITMHTQPSLPRTLAALMTKHNERTSVPLRVCLLIYSLVLCCFPYHHIPYMKFHTSLLFNATLLLRGFFSILFIAHALSWPHLKLFVRGVVDPYIGTMWSTYYSILR